MPQLPVGVQATHLGTYVFKGTNLVDMVSVSAAPLVGRAAFMPKEGPRGKGRRVVDRRGVAATGIMPLPDVLTVMLRDAFLEAAFAAPGLERLGSSGCEAGRTGGAGGVTGTGGAGGAGGAEAGGEHVLRSDGGSPAGAPAGGAVPAMEYAAWLARELALRQAAMGGEAAHSGAGGGSYGPRS